MLAVIKHSIDVTLTHYTHFKYPTQGLICAVVKQILIFIFSSSVKGRSSTRNNMHTKCVIRKRNEGKQRNRAIIFSNLSYRQTYPKPNSTRGVVSKGCHSGVLQGLMWLIPEGNSIVGNQNRIPLPTITATTRSKPPRLVLDYWSSWFHSLSPCPFILYAQVIGVILLSCSSDHVTLLITTLSQLSISLLVRADLLVMSYRHL